MIKTNLDIAENLAVKMRSELQMSLTEPINVKTVLRVLKIITLYRPLSTALYGLSVKSADNRFRFILVNSNTTRGRQHFTIAHELYHLYFDPDPHSHICREGLSDESERSANMFARAFLMPRAGILKSIPDDELSTNALTLTTVLELEALYGVSHTAMLIRLKELRLLSNADYERYMSVKVTREASLRGMDVDLYMNGNEGIVIGDYGAKARELFEKDIISEGHYVELLNKIGYGCGECEDRAGC